MLKEEERDSFRGRERHKRTSLFCKREAAVVRRLLTTTTTTVGAAMAAAAAAAAAAYHCGGSICPDLIPGRSVAVINRPEGRKLLKVGK